MPRAPKVFRYSDGFHAWTVAAPSRAKALAAWGMSRDLFKGGLAEEIEDGPDYAAALASPGDLIKRGLVVDIGSVERARPSTARAASSVKDRARATALEAELEALDEAQAGEAAALEVERKALESRTADMTRAHDRDRDAVKVRLKAARAKLS